MENVMSCLQPSSAIRRFIYPFIYIMSNLIAPSYMNIRRKAAFARRITQQFIYSLRLIVTDKLINSIELKCFQRHNQKFVYIYIFCTCAMKVENESNSPWNIKKIRNSNRVVVDRRMSCLNSINRKMRRIKCVIITHSMNILNFSLLNLGKYWKFWRMKHIRCRCITFRSFVRKKVTKNQWNI